MRQSKTFDFLTIKIEVVIREDPDPLFGDAWAGVYGNPIKKNPHTFRIWFKGIATYECVAHECWHLLFAVLKCLDCDHKHSFDELYGETYAYMFETLFSRVVNTLDSMSLYKGICEREGETK